LRVEMITNSMVRDRLVVEHADLDPQGPGQ